MIDSNELKRLRELPDIFLYSCVLGLIIDHPTGVVYSNQVGGYSVLKGHREGLFIPINSTVFINNQALKIDETFLDHFTTQKWSGYCDKGIDIETADFIDSILKESLYCKGMDLKVNRNKLEYCMEAWIEVTFTFPKIDAHYPEYPKLESSSGILTWHNSD